MAREKGFDAIKYEGNYQKPNGKYSYNLAILQKPDYLTPIGVYPDQSKRYEIHGRPCSTLSLPTIRGIQLLGFAGTTYSLYHAGQKIINSERPILEAGHQVALFSAAVKGGVEGGIQAIRPCAIVGAAFPVIAPYTVPVCIASCSILGGIIAASAVDLTWYAANETLATMFTSTPPEKDAKRLGQFGVFKNPLHKSKISTKENEHMDYLNQFFIRS